MFKRLYDSSIALSHSRSAPYALAAVAFAESSFFPLPPDILLAPMSLAEPKKAWRFALIATIASVLGGALGYAIGALLYDTIGHWLIHLYGYEDKMAALKETYARWGALVILVKGFTPIPFKLVTIVSGLLGYNFPLFIALSIITRGGRFLRARRGAQPFRRSAALAARAPFRRLHHRYAGHRRRRLLSGRACPLTRSVSRVSSSPQQTAAIAVFVLAFLTIAGAWIFQAIGYQPCDLCYEQRYAYYVGVPLAVIAIALAPRQPMLTSVLLVVIALIFAANVGLAIYHSGVELKWWQGPTACSGSALSDAKGGDLLSEIDKVKVVRCDDVGLRVFGLTLANYNIAISLALAAFAIGGAFSRRRG